MIGSMGKEELRGVVHRALTSKAEGAHVHQNILIARYRARPPIWTADKLFDHLAWDPIGFGCWANVSTVGVIIALTDGSTYQYYSGELSEAYNILHPREVSA